MTCFCGSINYEMFSSTPTIRRENILALRGSPLPSTLSVLIAEAQRVLLSAVGTLSSFELRLTSGAMDLTTSRTCHPDDMVEVSYEE